MTAGDDSGASTAGTPPVPAASDVPPSGEQIHLPEPTILPLVTALGISIALVGVVINVVLVVLGLIVTVLAIVRWVGDTRRDIDELPLEH